MRAFLLALTMIWGSVASAERVTVFAAASLKTALEEIAAGHDGDVTLVFAGSSALARQIAAGAPADLFLSANVAWMDDLEARGRIVAGSRHALLGNTLVAVAPLGPVPEDPFDVPRLAMGLVEAVPAGIYGKAALESLGLWETLAPRVVQSDNVRAALAFVALGEVPLGIVYGSDAVAEPRVQVVHRFAPDSHPPIVYPVARVAGDGSGDGSGDGGAGDGGAAFLAYLRGPEARAVFEAQGFEVLP